MVIPKSLSKYVLASEEMILSALKQMDEHALRNLIIVSGDVVVGVLTDGDVRRALIRGTDIREKVDKAMNPSFISFTCSESPQTIVETFQNNAISIVPIIDQCKRLKNVMTRREFEELLLSNNQITTTVNPEDYDGKEHQSSILARPWGYYKTMVLNQMFQSKIIYVLPGQSLSLQSHQHREEFWTIIDGRGKVQLEQSFRFVHPGDFVFIPKGCKHRINNEDDSKMLIFSEIQLGNYFGEDDIFRYDDEYGRLS